MGDGFFVTDNMPRSGIRADSALSRATRKQNFVLQAQSCTRVAKRLLKGCLRLVQSTQQVCLARQHPDLSRHRPRFAGILPDT